MKFILIRKDHFHDDDFEVGIPAGNRYGMELIRTEDIVHVYEVKGASANQVCIEYKNRKGGNSSVYESYEYSYEVIKRINELNILLNGGKTNETV